MAKPAVARETVFSLRRQIARIEGRPQVRLEPPPAAGEVVLRAGGVVRGAAAPAGLLATGADGLDAALGGGLPAAGLTELHGRAMREAGAVAGFALGLAAVALSAPGGAAGGGTAGAAGKGAAGPPPLLAWIGLADGHAEAGFPHAPGIAETFGIGCGSLLFFETARLADALWVAEEAARLDEPCVVLFELRGNPKALDLTATRRLHRRAAEAGRPFLLLRHSAEAEPTAAPVRLLVAPAPAGERPTLTGPLAGSIGAPRFAVAIGKGPGARTTQFELEWNCHDRLFRHAGTEIRRSLVPLSRRGEDPAPAARPLLARRAG